MNSLRSTPAHHLLPLVLLLAACQSPPANEPEAMDRSVTAEAAGVRIVSLPDIFEVAVNDGERLELVAVTPLDGRVALSLGDVVAGGINIVDAVKATLAAFETLPQGQSFGQTQLVAPIGLTYMARGRYLSGDTPTEELKALLVHPWGDRLLTIAYTYPVAEDTAERGAHLMDLLGEIEPLDPPAADAAPVED